MARRQPLWRKGFDTIERSVGRPLEETVRSELFFDLLALSTRARRRAAMRIDRLTGGALHAVNLPARSDIRQLRQQITRMERRIAQLSKQIDDRSEDQEDASPNQP